jgi:hypothetical protein
MPRSFNTTGPCRPDIHYTLPSIARLPNLERLIEQQNYFVIHAPRQTGKSTAMMALAQQLTEQGKFLAVLVSAEVGAPFSTDTGKVELAILGSWARVTKQRLSIELLARLGLDFGWLVIFDRRRDLLPIEERLRSQMHRTAQGREITVIYA